MKSRETFIAVTAIILSIIPVWAFNLPLQALQNIIQTPGCATSCIFDGHWAKTYAPNCNGPPNVEQGACLCRTYMYQHMMDNCIKEKCSDNDRRLVPAELSLN